MKKNKIKTIRMFTEPTGTERRQGTHLYALFVAFFVLTLLGGPHLLRGVYNGGMWKWGTAASVVESNREMPPKKVLQNPFGQLTLEAKSAYVLDVTTGDVIYSKNADEVVPLASLTKVMTAVVATDLIPDSIIVTISKEDVANEGDSGLFVGERWRLSDIINLTLVASSNDGASAIATAAGSFGQSAYGYPSAVAKEYFIKKMNEKGKMLGFLNTVFYNETGLDVNEYQSGAYGTAKEMALLARYVIENKLSFFEATSLAQASFTSLDGILHSIENTNEHVGDMPGVIMSKTGFTDLAGGNLMVAADLGLMHPVAIVVLGSTVDGRFNDVEKLLWATIEYFKFKENNNGQ